MEMGILQLIVIMSSIPGSMLIVLVIDKFNPKRAQQYVQIMWFSVLLLGGIILTGPERKIYLHIFAIFVGL